jgi:cell division protein FtsB
MGWTLFSCAWIIILAWYLANAYQRIAQLEKRLDELEGKNN